MNAPAGSIAAHELIAAFKEATTSALACEILDRALAAAEADDCYQALKLARRIIRHEDAVLGRTPAVARARAQFHVTPRGINDSHAHHDPGGPRL